MLYHAFITQRRLVYRSWTRCTTVHLSQCRYQSSAATIQQEKTRSNLNVIDFYHASLSSSPHHYAFKLGVSGYPKKGKVIEPITQDDAIYTSVQVGDDAYFQRRDALGVADGVGGWRKHAGANPALYSRKLMHYAQLELDRIKSNVRPYNVPQNHPDPIQVLENAYHLTSLDAQNEVRFQMITRGIVGSTTACIITLCQDELRIANLGDCGVSIIRCNDYIFRSEEQQHSFNFPYQLGTASFDSPADAQRFTVKIEEGDIIILGSDGLFDNLYDEEILEELIQTNNNHTATIGCAPQKISDALALRAKLGGKADDISVLVAVISRDECPPEPSPPPLP
ncbi:phosphatase 2C-like domain-containing protein [Radiomyces spectabilis]|uniref:phosphatase 2C-like domain-containing protein n=1 Tax=Radiomyces spectabilis TaxID=64574 RepID=UPI002220D178|nr:phosphatase 2C-like domain-containing protein [Radiomyces spectabilis]KAI8393380.1 phosphatase 2C-like domain-containing protein [Radiomyces spectabilis]